MRFNGRISLNWSTIDEVTTGNATAEFFGALHSVGGSGGGT